MIRLNKNEFILGVGETIINQSSSAIKDQTFGKFVNIRLNEISKKLIFNKNQMNAFGGIGNCLKVNLKIRIEYLINPDNPDDKTFSKTWNNNSAPKKINSAINLATHINGPHRNKSIEQSSILQHYEKAFSQSLLLNTSPNKDNVNKDSNTGINIYCGENKNDLSNSFISDLLNENGVEDTKDFELQDSYNYIYDQFKNTYTETLLKK